MFPLFFPIPDCNLPGLFIRVRILPGSGGSHIHRGHVRPDRQGGGGASRIEPERERIFRILEARPELPIHGLRKALAAQGITFSFATVQRFLKRHGLERSKRLAAADLIRKSRPRTGA